MAQPAAAAISRETSVEYSDANQQEDQIQTYDDKLAADYYKDYSSQNQIAIQVFLALAGAGVGYGIEVRDAYAFFAKEKIDAEKLIKSPVYRAQIKKHLDHINFWEKGAVEKGTSKLGAVLEGANKAVKEVDETNKKLASYKESLVKDYAAELQNLYGLDKGEIEAIIQRAKYAVHKDPNLSVQDLVQTEAQNMARNKIKTEVESEARAKNEQLSPKQKDTAIKVKTAQKKLAFEEKTQLINNFEEEHHITLTSNCKYELDKILTTTPPAATAPQSVVTPTLQPPPVPTPIIATPPMISSIPIPGGLSLRNVPIPTFGGFKTGLNVLGGGFGKLFGGMGNYIGRRGLGRFVNLVGNLGKRALNRALDAFMPGLGMTVGKINDVIKSILGVDVEATIIKGAAILVGVVAVIVIILPLLIGVGGVGVFSHITGNNPIQLSFVNNKNISWNEFNKQYLATDSNVLLSWRQFEKENLSSSKQLLTLDPNRHDDVQKR